MKTDKHFWSFLAQFLFEGEMFHEKVVEKIITHIFCSMILSPKIVPIIRQCGMILKSRTGHR